MNVKRRIKKTRNNQHSFPVYIMNFSVDSGLKDLNVNGKKILIAPESFFMLYIQKN